ncbi:Uncharacterised protein [Acinetobacter baumannii]|nr:Uncharacterised protein [Acinetobacter baumannii]
MPVQADILRHQEIRQQQQHAEQDLHVERLPVRQRDGPAFGQHAIQRVRGGGEQHHQFPFADTVLQQRARLTAADQPDQTAEGENAAEQHADGRRNAQQYDADQDGQQWDQRHDDAHKQRADAVRRVIGQALIQHHAEQAEDHQLPPVGAHLRPVAQHALQHKRRQGDQRQQPAVERDGRRIDGGGGEFADDGVNRPNQHGQQGEKHIHDNYSQ